MADLSRRGDRGQLVLVTALAIAVAMVALVLLVNTGIYTQNLATRDGAPGDRGAFEYREGLRGGAGDVIDAENDAEYDSFDAVRANASAGVNRTDDLLARDRLTGGTAAGINRSTAAYHEGRLVRQTDGSRNLSDVDGDATWTMATGVDDTRAYRMTVDRSSLTATDEGSVAGSSAFRVVLDDGSRWRAYVYENSTTNEVAVATEPPGESPEERCSVDQSSATVGFTGGTLANESCPGLVWAEGLTAAYDIEYRNGDGAVGSYNLTVNVTGAATVNAPSELNTDPDAGSPYAVPAVYDLTATMTYESPGVRYRERIRVAPGESGA